MMSSQEGARAAMNDGSMHVLGNGQLCAYGQGADLVQIFGPPYSAPELGRLVCDPPAQFQSWREPGAAIWNHRLPGVELTDFVDASLACLVRRQLLPVVVHYLQFPAG